MSPCDNYGSVIICRGPAMEELARVPGPDLWCFRCQEHRMHYVLWMDEAVPGYYGADFTLRCDRCDEAATDFHGNRRWTPEAQAILEAIPTPARSQRWHDALKALTIEGGGEPAPPR